MSRPRQQLFIGVLLLAAASVVAMYFHWNVLPQMPHAAFLTGWVLLGAMVVLTVYNIRKKLPFLPLGNSETWLQIHIYLGFFTTLLFLIHLKFRMPHGWFDTLLAALFLLVSGSGVVGLFFSRTLPRRLSSKGGEVIFEKIPGLRHSLQTQAEQLALGPAATSPAIADFYVNELAAFFAGPRTSWKHLIESSRAHQSLQARLDMMRRFATEKERELLEKLSQLVRQKDGLDYHRALQLSLRLWLFVHIPLTYGLMLFTALHIVLVFAFSGGAG